MLFSGFAGALAKGRGKARADSLRTQRHETRVKVPAGPADAPCTATEIPSVGLRAGQIVLVPAGDPIPTDAEVVDGLAAVDESAITGASAPVIRESGGDRQQADAGLGLAISRGPVEAQVGRIRAEPVRADGGGTRIVIALPLDHPGANP